MKTLDKKDKNYKKYNILVAKSSFYENKEFFFNL